MPKFTLKRNVTEAEPPPLASYLSAQPIDYTALPIVEDKGAAARFWRLSLPTRVSIVALPILLLVLGAWGSLVLRNANAQVQEQPAPEFTLSEVRVVNPSEIAIEGIVDNVPNGTVASAKLLAAGTELAWADPVVSTGAVEGGRLDFRIRKAATWTKSLDRSSSYAVEVLLASDPLTSAQAELVVPGPLAVEFFGPEIVAVLPSPTPEPTTAPTLEPTVEPTLEATPEPTLEPTAAPTLAPTPEPTPEPVPVPATLTAGADATLWSGPSTGSGAITRAAPGTTYQPLMRTPDSQFFLVIDANRAGWLAASQLTIDEEQAARVPVSAPPAEAVAAGPVLATVVTGGNIRFLPSRETGTVLGLMQHNETVTVKGRTASGAWYRVVAPAAEGWASITLLSFAPGVEATIPVLEPNQFVPQGFDVSVAPGVASPPAPAKPSNSPPSLVAHPGAALLISPSAEAEVVARPAPGTTYRPLLRTPASTFFLVLEGTQTGWLAANQVVIDPAQAARVPVTTPSQQAVLAGPLRATIAQDGNVRIGPLVTATILGTAHAGETVTVKARTADGSWYRIVAPGAEGWFSAALFGLPPAVASKVPVAN